MKKVGAHVSAAGGVSNAPGNAQGIGAKAFAMFVKNQRQWFAKVPEAQEIKQFKDNLQVSGIDINHILPHGSYLLNLATPSQESFEMSLRSLLSEMEICAAMGLKYLNIHPGSALDSDETESLHRVAYAINLASEKIKNVTIVIENTAGQGSNVGYKLEHLKTILSHVVNKSLVGFCIDTCHAFAAGYDLRSEDLAKAFFDDFDKIVGLKYLKGMHLNDSKTELNSRKDRHESLGQGYIGLDVFKYIMKSKEFNNMPLILETVNPDIWKEEIEMLYSFI